MRDNLVINFTFCATVWLEHRFFCLWFSNNFNWLIITVLFSVHLFTGAVCKLIVCEHTFIAVGLHVHVGWLVHAICDDVVDITPLLRVGSKQRSSISLHSAENSAPSSPTNQSASQPGSPTARQDKLICVSYRERWSCWSIGWNNRRTKTQL